MPPKKKALDVVISCFCGGVIRLSKTSGKCLSCEVVLPLLPYEPNEAVDEAGNPIEHVSRCMRATPLASTTWTLSIVVTRG